eukprot:TRINITY_DN46960_c0_g1_i1.p1 TRINITY_DN46960_c0_g1~~TRINITY_DN46960_c0_g1_i1.p1  ORF type:complete len:347 (+),score=108.04 TRINITY_DN46960_c0_g1_i1:70-1041(+)
MRAARCAAPVRRALAGLAQRRSFNSLPEEAYRRPENSSAVSRSVQDWKPMIQQVAHEAGLPEAPEGSEKTVLHMTLVDHQGFRWPVRFLLTTGMTVWDVVALTDYAWFDLRFSAIRSQNIPNQTPSPREFEHPMVRCRVGEPSVWECQRCVVAFPYQYLDAMAPPEAWEIRWLLWKMRQFVLHITANCRLACQVVVEDWMDGMTVVLPQTDSLAFNMYVASGTDKDSSDQFMGAGPQPTGGPHSAGYLWRNSGGPGTAYPENLQETMRWRDSQHESQDQMPTYTFNRGAGSNVPLRDIFWLDSVDDIIRERHPDYKGKYQYSA